MAWTHIKPEGPDRKVNLRPEGPFSCFTSPASCRRPRSPPGSSRHDNVECRWFRKGYIYTYITYITYITYTGETGWEAAARIAREKEEREGLILLVFNLPPKPSMHACLPGEEQLAIERAAAEEAAEAAGGCSGGGCQAGGGRPFTTSRANAQAI